MTAALEANAGAPVPVQKRASSFCKGYTRPLAAACVFIVRQVVQLHQAKAWAELQKIDKDPTFHPVTGDRIGELREQLDPAWSCWQTDAGTFCCVLR